MYPAFDSESFSDKGGRVANEDSQGSAEVNGIWCWVVADGLGGHEGGQLASRTALSAVLDSFRRRPEVTPDSIRRHIAYAHAAIQALQGERHGQHQMGTTLVILISDGTRAIWGHVGDSRLFHFRGGRMVEQTRDHSMTQVPAGALAEGDGGEGERERSGLLQAVGLTGEIIPAVLANPVQLAPGDAFLLCVDGFWDKIFEVEMAADLAKSDSTRAWLRNMCGRIHARLKEGDDNYTAIAVRAVGVRAPVIAAPAVAGPVIAAPVKGMVAAAPSAPPKTRRPSMKQAAILTGVVALAILTFVGVTLYLRSGKKPPPDGTKAVVAGPGWDYPVVLIQHGSFQMGRKPSAKGNPAKANQAKTDSPKTGDARKRTDSTDAGAANKKADSTDAGAGNKKADSTDAGPARGSQADTHTRDKTRDPDDILHDVELTVDFYFGRYEVSQRDWNAVMGDRPDPSKFKCLDCPVEQVSWLDAIAFANEASGKNGLKACYDLTGIASARCRDHPEKCVLPVAECHGYRLPTEAEWEFTAHQEIHEGDLQNRAWVADNAVVASNSGGTTRARVRGALLDQIFDLAGNVSEWVWDAYGAYSPAKATDPAGPAQSGRRVIRGCGYETRDLTTCAPTFRRGEPPETKSEFVGFRLVCTAGSGSCGAEKSPPK